MVVGVTQRMRGRGEGEETNIHRDNRTIIQMEKTINSDDLNMRVIQVQANLSSLIMPYIYRVRTRKKIKQKSKNPQCLVWSFGDP